MTGQHTHSPYYLPGTWDDFVGNRQVVRHFKNIVRTIRIEKQIKDHSTLLIGPSGVGKTAMVRKMAQCILCENLCPETLNCCNKCEACKKLAYLEGNDDIVSRIDADEGRIDHIFSPIDCTKSNLQIQSCLGELQVAPSKIRIAHLEEVGCLANDSKDLETLVPLEDRGFIWIGTGMDYKGLSPAFFRRFATKLRPTLPTRDELAIWLTKQSVGFGVRCESLETMQRLAERAGLRPAYGLQVIKYAQNFPGDEAVITRDMVEEHIFDFNE